MNRWFGRCDATHKAFLHLPICHDIGKMWTPTLHILYHICHSDINKLWCFSHRFYQYNCVFSPKKEREGMHQNQKNLYKQMEENYKGLTQKLFAYK